MKRILSTAMVFLVLAGGVRAQSAPDGAELTRLVKEFLDGASRSDRAMHDRFWADDLIYTGSSGRRIGKADILRDQRPARAPGPGEPSTVFSAEDIRIQQYDTTAIVAFRLVATTRSGEKTEIANYLNTGAFLKRGGKWQVVSWQATKMPGAEADAKRDVAAIESAFHRAILGADIKTLESLVDEGFIWTQGAGAQMTKRRLLEELGSARLKYSKLENNNVTVAVYGDTAIIRGVSRPQRSSIPGEPSADASAFTIFYTITFVNKGGAWKAVAMHSSGEHV